MGARAPLHRLDAARDMLANVDVNGDAVACARFMGGREYARLCELTGSDPGEPVTLAQLQATVDAGVLALPDFSGGSGPLHGTEGRVTAVPQYGAALATLYLALMIELELELLFEVEARIPVVPKDGRFGRVERQVDQRRIGHDAERVGEHVPGDGDADQREC